jgi:hypothetical protein
MHRAVTQPDQNAKKINSDVTLSTRSLPMLTRRAVIGGSSCVALARAAVLHLRRLQNAFGPILQPNVCVLLDVGTQPGPTSIYHLWKVRAPEMGWRARKLLPHRLLTSIQTLRAPAARSWR